LVDQNWGSKIPHNLPPTLVDQYSNLYKGVHYKGMFSDTEHMNIMNS